MAVESLLESLLRSSATVSLHGKTYHIPRRPTVVVCVDGFDPEYLHRGIEAGILPHLSRFMSSGFHTVATSCMPSFTNPNNVSIITGAPPAVHGIAGNFFLDPQTEEEHMITDDTYLRGSTILAELEKAGIRVAAITAKDKLRRILGHGLNRSICFSTEKANASTMEENRISNVEQWLGNPAPSPYSAELSLLVLDAGIKLLEEDRFDVAYLTLSDYIQHQYAPGATESDQFLSALDQKLGRLAELGAVVAVTGDHGMNDKSNEDGTPHVLYLQDELEKKFGHGSIRVICPITDPFVKHHGALGSFVRIHCRRALDVKAVMQFCSNLPEVDATFEGSVAAEKFELPLDREGDIVVIAKRNAVIGSRKSEHDLSHLNGHRLRSHGGLSEQQVPLILSVPLCGLSSHTELAERTRRNYDIFDLALNLHADTLPN